jgi:hypothetical protein
MKMKMIFTVLTRQKKGRQGCIYTQFMSIGLKNFLLKGDLPLFLRHEHEFEPAHTPSSYLPYGVGRGVVCA